MKKIKISAVSYTNTKPFVYGLQHSEVINQIDLSLDIPSDCAAKLIDGRVDIGLIPVAAIPQVPNAQIISSYCIGSIGVVNSVFIFSHVPVEEIQTLKLDSHSRTSNNLAKVLLKHHFKKEVNYITEENADYEAIVLIGDRTFEARKNFKYHYDMGQEWMNFTGLPFMYAAWVANKELSEEFVIEFDKALKYGISHISDLCQELPQQEGVDWFNYLSKQLNFNIDDEKIRAKDLFLKYIEEGL